MKKPLRKFDNIRVLRTLLKGDSLAVAPSAGSGHDEIRIDPRHAIPGDLVNLETSPRKRAGKFQAHRVERVEDSPNRRPAACPHFGACGGCRWQTMNYKTQLQTKQELLELLLQSLQANDHCPAKNILASPQEFEYRNKMEFTFSSARWFEDPAEEDQDKLALGLFVPGSSSRVVDIHSCRLQDSTADKIRNWFRDFCRQQGWAFYNHRRPEPGPAMRTLVLRSNSRGEFLLICIHSGEMQKEMALASAQLSGAFPQIRSIYSIQNDKGNDSYADLDPTLRFGQPHIVEEIHGLHFEIGPLSFFQTNTPQTPVLYSTAFELAGLAEASQPAGPSEGPTKKKLVFDLYTGTGTIASLFAHCADRVLGIEQVEEAVSAARAAAKANGLDNVEFICGDMKEVFTEDFLASQGRPDLVLCDPPRAGMHPDVLAALVASGVDEILYISCNPASFVADMQRLEHTYRIASLVPVDMAPQTPHLELVAKLLRRVSV